MVGKRSFLLCLLLICFSGFANCRVQKSSKDKSQSVERSEHVKEVHTRQSDSQDQLKNDHEQSSRVDSTVVKDQSQAQVDAKQSLPPSHTNKETSSTTSVPDNEETASSEVSDGRSEQSPSEEEGTLSRESDDTLQPGVATGEDNDDEGGGESGESASEQGDEDGQHKDEDDKDGEREEEREDERKDERENEGDKDGKDGQDSAQEKKPATASEPADDKYKEGSKLIESLEYSVKKRGYELLQMAAEAGNNKAKAALAYGYLYGNMLKRNFTKAFEMFTWLADRGVPAGQQGLGFMYSTGIGVNASQAKAILYYTFAALGGHPSAMLTMAYRSRLGVGTSVSCEAALAYYHKVANKVRSQVSMFTGGFAVQKARLSDSDDGGSPTVFGGVSEDELEHYSEVFADTGSNVQISLGLYYMFGLGGTDKNLVKALAYLKRAAAEDYATASALIGRVYAEGSPPEIPQSNETALNYFRKSVKLNSGEGLTGLGMMYFLGMGVEKDYSVAKQHLMKAAEKGSAEAHYYIGLMLMNGLGGSPNPTKAVSHFKVAAQAGHILAIYELGQVNAKGLTGQRNCDQAVELLKAVAERGRWSKLLREAYRTYHAGEVDSALMMYLLLGEMGYEIAQSNAAYILEEVGSDMLDYNETYKRALVLWGRSASQGYATARVKLGDYYYYGLGADEDLELAAEQYRMASDRMGSPQAMFNLGYMYELGIGLEQDYHLAKRYYDMAAETSREAALPVSLALIKLTAVQYYTDLLKYLRGEGGSDQSTVSTEDSSFSLEEDEEGVELSDFEQNWDIYLTALLCVLLVVIIRWRRR